MANVFNSSNVQKWAIFAIRSKLQVIKNVHDPFKYSFVFYLFSFDKADQNLAQEPYLKTPFKFVLLTQKTPLFSSWQHEWHFSKNKLSFVLAVPSKQLLASQEWFVAMMCAVALLTLLVLIGCFVLKNKGGKYAGKTQTASEVTQTSVQALSSL